VKEEQRKLTNRTQAVKGREQLAEQAISDATAEKELYVSHLRAIKVTEDALADRERASGMKRSTLKKERAVKTPQATVSTPAPKKKRGRPKKRR